MSERMTDISGGPHTPGVMECGRRTRAEMIAAYRAHFEHQRDEAERALSVADEALIVTTFLGPWACRNREVVS